VSNTDPIILAELHRAFWQGVEVGCLLSLVVIVAVAVGIRLWPRRKPLGLISVAEWRRKYPIDG